jgi:hypothetical protein
MILGVFEENHNTDKNVNSEAYANEAADGNEDFIESWARGQPCYVLAQIFSTLFLWPYTVTD